MMRREFVLGMLVLAGAACGSGRPSTQAAEREVGGLLYERNLIAAPEVNAKVRDLALDVGQGRVSEDSALAELRPWLQAWVRSHSDEAARANLLPRIARP
jgi:hypothetical protein